MTQKTTRLHFIDAMRAWAILMMLQGHFIDGLLQNEYKNTDHVIYLIWSYFRGITAPVFFTVSGFIFTFLLLRRAGPAWRNPRVKKGLKRGLELIIIGYLLRLNLGGLLQGTLYSSFFLVDVLHCIGLSIIIIIGCYLLSGMRSYVFPSLLLAMTLCLFYFEPWYKAYDFSGLPLFAANYFSKINGSVFTIIPWVGYTSFGGFMAWNFKKYKDRKQFYPVAIALALTAALFLMFASSPIFAFLGEYAGFEIAAKVALNNYLFIRLGDVFWAFALFMMLRGLLVHKTILAIGRSTLSIYVIHFIILYGSFTGMGLYRYWHGALKPVPAILGALLFMFVCTWLALYWEKRDITLKKIRLLFTSKP